jgi:hypothetical protein
MKRNRFWIVLGFASGTLGVIWLMRRARQTPAPWSWTKPILVRIHGEEIGNQLVLRAEARYRILLEKRPLTQHRALRRHLTRSILPGLALYQILLEHHRGDQQVALDEMDQVFEAWTTGRRINQMVLLHWLPSPFTVFRAAFELLWRTSFPPEGWGVEWVENSNRRIAFDIRRCFYKDTLTTYGSPELTSHFCRGDDLLAEMFPPSIGYRRTTTLGRGGDRCDFRYWNVDRMKESSID